MLFMIDEDYPQTRERIKQTEEMIERQALAPQTREQRVRSRIKELQSKMKNIPEIGKVTVQVEIDFLRGEYTTALEYLNHHPEIETCSRHLCLRAWTHHKLGNYLQAYKDCQGTIFVPKDNYRIQMILGKIYTRILVENCYIEDTIKYFRNAYTIANTLSDKHKQRKALEYLYRTLKKQWYLKHEPEFTETFEVPSQFCCPISFEPMLFPIITEAGYTYEERFLHEHIHKNGFTDPISRKRICMKLFKNTSLQILIREYLESNPWAFEYQPSDKAKYCIK